MKPSQFSTKLNSCTSCGLSDSEMETAKETAKQTEEEAARFSNPDIPWPLKLTGIALIVFLLTRN